MPRAITSTRHSHIRTNERMYWGKRGEEKEAQGGAGAVALQLRGRVVRGAGLGRRLGYPTANLTRHYFHHHPVPDGIYYGVTKIGERHHPSLAIIGVDKKVEIYILDWHKNLYGSHLFMKITKKLRGLRSFATQQKLKTQIKKDIAAARRIMRSKNF